MSSILAVLQTRWGEELDEYIASRISASTLHSQLQVMLGYQLGYVDAGGNPAAVGGGKRFRPLLCLLASEAVAGRWRAALPIAAAIELLHNFSLIHDDIEDNDPLRRHRPTLWAIWGVPLAINAGDAMFALSQRVILDLDAEPDTTVNVARRFSDMAIELTHGQHRDMESESRTDVNQDEYLQTIARKSAAIIAFSLWSGTIAGGGGAEQAHALERFGLELGLAFQIQDDILGIWAPRGETGKEEAKDLENRKKTLPVLLAAERATGGPAEVLRSYLGGGDYTVKQILVALRQVGARGRSTEQLHVHLDAARRALASAGLSESHQKQFEQLARDITRQ